MINILIAALGVILIIGGFYAMSFGFSNPPNISFFLIGLFLSVLGAILVIIFGSQINTASLKSKGVKEKKSPATSSPKLPKKAKIPESPKKIQPKFAKKPQDSGIKHLVTDKKDDNEEKEATPLKKVKPKNVEKKDIDSETSPKEIKPVSKNPVSDNNTVKDKPKVALKEIKPVPIKTGVENNTVKPKMVPKGFKPVKFGENTAANKSEEEYVKNRLNRLKENYIKNANDIENLIEERLDSFKGTLNQIKSESKDPSIIWSFDAGDVQETMQETILKADKKIMMMYPWIRNIDVGVLKKFMETDSKIILQEASLDDDASVELIKLLTDSNVKIRTMPHVHTVAIVSDEDNGLIISTDPIYESFEVGVIYKDQKSIEEIGRMFNEAWNLSQEIDLSLN